MILSYRQLISILLLTPLNRETSGSEIWRKRQLFIQDWGKTIIFSFFIYFFLSSVHFLFKTFTPFRPQTEDGTGLTPSPVTQCHGHMGVLCKGTNPCIVVVFLQNSQHQQQGRCKVLVTVMFPSVMGAIISTCAAIRTALGNEMGYRKEGLLNLLTCRQCELPNIK